MKRYFIIARTTNGKTSYLNENPNGERAAYVWRRGAPGLQHACLFESRARAEARIAASYSKKSDGSPFILEVEEQKRYAITALASKTAFWLVQAEVNGEMKFRWLGGEEADQKAYRFITRAAAVAVMGARPAGHRTAETVVAVFDRVVMS